MSTFDRLLYFQIGRLDLEADNRFPQLLILAIHKYNDEIYELALEAFCALPLAAVMNKQFLCIHGGISPEFQTIDDMRKVFVLI